jgi:hypothetical protein
VGAFATTTGVGFTPRPPRVIVEVVVAFGVGIFATVAVTPGGTGVATPRWMLIVVTFTGR